MKNVCTKTQWPCCFYVRIFFIYLFFYSSLSRYFIDWWNVGGTHASINVHKWISFTSVWLSKFATTGSWLPWISSSSHKRQIDTHVATRAVCTVLTTSRRSTIFSFFPHKTPTWMFVALIHCIAVQKFQHFTRTQVIRSSSASAHLMRLHGSSFIFMFVLDGSALASFKAFGEFLPIWHQICVLPFNLCTLKNENNFIVCSIWLCFVTHFTTELNQSASSIKFISALPTVSVCTFSSSDAYNKHNSLRNDSFARLLSLLIFWLCVFFFGCLLCDRSFLVHISKCAKFTEKKTQRFNEHYLLKIPSVLSTLWSTQLVNCIIFVLFLCVCCFLFCWIFAAEIHNENETQFISAEDFWIIFRENNLF